MMMILKKTPFVILELKGKYTIGRSDTRELLCIGTFNKNVADVLDAGDMVFLKIKPDGSAIEYDPPKDMEPVDAVKFTDDNCAIVMAKCDCYWLTPYGFKEWAKTVFKGK